MKPDDKKLQPPAKLEGNERVVVQALMPITLIWHDFLARHEYIDDKTAINVNVTALMQLVRDTTDYINNTYKYLNVSQEQFDEIANNIAPLLYPQNKPEPPHPDKNGDSAPRPVRKK